MREGRSPHVVMAAPAASHAAAALLGLPPQASSSGFQNNIQSNLLWRHPRQPTKDSAPAVFLVFCRLARVAPQQLALNVVLES